MPLPFSSLPSNSDEPGLCKLSINSHNQATHEGIAILLTCQDIAEQQTHKSIKLMLKQEGALACWTPLLSHPLVSNKLGQLFSPQHVGKFRCWNNHQRMSFPKVFWIT